MNVVSFTLFGEAADYHRYLPAAIRAHHNLYRGWSFRIHHDGRGILGPYNRALRALADRGLVELVFVDTDAPFHRAMLWRLLPIWDTAVERLLTRDIDTVPTFRERRAVEIWIRSGLAVHAISDKQGHHDYPTLGGMMGFQAAQTRALLDASSFEVLIDRARWPEAAWLQRSGWRMSNFTTNNQLFLGEQVWPRIQKSACEHRLSWSRKFDAALSFGEVELINEDLGISKTIRELADGLVSFIGSSLSNSRLADAFIFYRIHGDPEIEQVITSCEIP